jgi:hypothetical protein
MFIKLTFSDSVESHDKNKMQHVTSDILFSLFKMTFNLKGSFDQEFSFIVKIKKEKLQEEQQRHKDI